MEVEVKLRLLTATAHLRLLTAAAHLRLTTLLTPFHLKTLHQHNLFFDTPKNDLSLRRAVLCLRFLQTAADSAAATAPSRCIRHDKVCCFSIRKAPMIDGNVVGGFVKTLAMALGSEEEAKKLMYSVSTNYYYAFGCRIHETFTYKIRSLPDVKWVLPDSFIVDGESGYGGESFVAKEVVAYDEKYHADWLRDQTDEDAEIRVVTKKPRRKRNKKLRSSSVTNMKSCKQSKCDIVNTILEIFLKKI